MLNYCEYYKSISACHQLLVKVFYTSDHLETWLLVIRHVFNFYCLKKTSSNRTHVYSDDLKPLLYRFIYVIIGYSRAARNYYCKSIYCVVGIEEVSTHLFLGVLWHIVRKIRSIWLTT